MSNAGLRAISSLDTLAASQVLKRLHHHYRLLEQGGAGSATYYRLAGQSVLDGELPLFAAENTNTGDLSGNTGDLSGNTGDLSGNTGDLQPDAEELPAGLHVLIKELTPKARKEKLWPVIVWLCALKPRKAEQLALLLGNRQLTALKSNHINALRSGEGLLAYTHPEVINHPEQAYITTDKGLRWLTEKGIKPCE